MNHYEPVSVKANFCQGHSELRIEASLYEKFGQNLKEYRQRARRILTESFFGRHCSFLSPGSERGLEFPPIPTISRSVKVNAKQVHLIIASPQSPKMPEDH